MKSRRMFSIASVLTVMFLMLLNVVIPTISSQSSQENQERLTKGIAASLPPGQDNMTFTTGTTLNLTTGATINFTTGRKMKFTTNITIQFTDINGTGLITQDFYGQLTTSPPSQLEPCSYWEIFNGSNPSAVCFHVDAVYGDVFHVDVVSLPGMWHVLPSQVVTAELRINNMTQDSEFVVRDPPGWTPPSNSWWRVRVPVEWKVVEFHVDWSSGSKFHVDQVNGTQQPLTFPPYEVVAEQEMESLEPGDYFVVKDPASVPQNCSWWKILDPKQHSTYEFHVDWQHSNGTFRVDNVKPNSITFVPEVAEIWAEKEITTLQPCINFTFVSSGGSPPGYNDSWQILNPDDLGGYEIRTETLNASRVHVIQVIPTNQTLDPPVHKLIVEKKIKRIDKGNWFKVADPQGWAPDLGSWWKIISPTQWSDTVFRVGASDEVESKFRIEFVNRAQFPSPPMLPWNVTAVPTEAHDLAVYSAPPWLTPVYQGWPCPILVTVINQGSHSETFDVHVEYFKYGDVPEGSIPITTSPITVSNLPSGENETLRFFWITNGVRLATYNIRAYIHNMTDEVDTSDNEFINYGSPVVKTPLSFYWEEGFGDYAVSGMPDLDQRQANWKNPSSGRWSYSGPSAVANALWWFDSRFEPRQPPLPPPDQSDEFPLVSSYLPGVDDHDMANVPSLITHLAHLMDTDGKRTGILHEGTNATDMKAGLAQYFSWTGVNPLGDVNGDGTVDQADVDIVNASMYTEPDMTNWNMAADIWPETVTGPFTADNNVTASDLALVVDHLGETGLFRELFKDKPDPAYVEQQLANGNDVVLQVGYWEYNGSAWNEELGKRKHFVTVSGVNATNPKILISDPAFDAYEKGQTPEGYSPIQHAHTGTEPPFIMHNDAQFVSYDMYELKWIGLGGGCPGGNYALWDYPGGPTNWLAIVESAFTTSSLGVHDIAVTHVTTSKAGCMFGEPRRPIETVCQNFTANVTITIENQGNFSEMFNVIGYANSTAIGSQNIPLASGESATITLVWDTTGFLKGKYIITAYIQPVHLEFHISNNNAAYAGTLEVVYPGDINGDRIVDIFDIAYIARVFSSTPADPDWQPNADIKADGMIDIFDIVVVALHFGDTDP